MSELKIPCVITTTPVAMCLNARMRFVQFLAPFFNREKEADDFFAKVSESLKQIRERAAGARENPRVMWGDIYEKRVLVEPGNAWVGELVGLAQSDYLFEDVFGTSCIEISVERFLYSGKDADIYFTYRAPEDGATSKAALARMNPLFSNIRPLHEGKVFQSQAGILPIGPSSGRNPDRIAAILHPELYPGFQLQYFIELPDVDPASEKASS
jgi:iron complex transport system substrate-binding protein